MLAFPSNPPFAEYYNYKINDFLHTEYYDLLREALTHDDCDIEDELVPFFGSSHLRREDPEKCLNIVSDLYNWSSDNLNHRLSYLHLFSLYNFLCYMDDLLDDDENFRRIYYGGKDEEAAVDRAWEKYKNNSIEGINTKQKLKNYLQDIYNMIGDCFEDTDFITFPEIISDAISKNEDVSIDLVGDFVDLLPQDILQHYREIHHERTDLFNNINEVLADIQHNLKYCHEYKLLWVNNKPRKEKDVHNYLGAILSACFRKDQIQIDREVDVGIGRVDFRLLNNSLEKVLIEVKLASNDNLEAGLTKQLAQYMDASKCTQAYYLIFSFTDEDYERALKIIEKFQGSINRNIVVRVFDARQKLAASKLR